MLEDIYNWSNNFPKFIEDLETMLTNNRIFKQRTVEIGTMTSSEALDLGMSGPCLRASGLAWDLRKTQPYDCYDEMDFDIPVGNTGDCYARYLVRIEEMKQSLRIIKQIIDRMPKGPVISDNNKISPPKRKKMKESMESLIHHFKLYTEGFRLHLKKVTQPLKLQKENLEFT